MLNRARWPAVLPGTPRPRALGTAALVVTLAYVGGYWLHAIHEAAGAVEPGAPPSLVHWLRDSTLLVPVVAVAGYLALVFAAWLSGRPRARMGGLTERVSTIAVVALVVSAAEGISAPLHGLLFGGHELHGAEQAVASHMLADGLSALPANLLIVTVVLVVLGDRLWIAPGRRHGSTYTFATLVGRRTVTTMVAVMLAMVPSSSALAPAVVAAAPARPCPATAPVKSFDVSAIDIRMWLNRFGDSDPSAQMYVLTNRIADVRAMESAGPSALSNGVRDDVIQPLVIRANLGDCVTIHYTNETTRPAPQATSNTYGMHIEGLAFDTSTSSGDALGANASSAPDPGQSADYTYYVPDDPLLEGAHLIQPGPGNRQAVAHGLFGVLTVEPKGSTYLNMTTGQPQISGWEANIVPGTGKAFRENVQVFHEVGNESERDNTSGPVDVTGSALRTIDPHTGAYRPGSRAINYRSEPFMDRLDFADDQKSGTYSSYTFGDTSNVIARGYLGDPTKFRVVHAGSEVFHVYHLHGGADRWRLNPEADPTFDYGKTGLDKKPIVVQAQSDRVDSQTIGPGESYSMEIENGAGGAQQGAGEFLFHCHIGHHYVAGMWGYWRVYDTLQPDLVPLPDRTPLAKAVTSADLVGKTINGQKITKQNLDAWIRPQLPPQGVTKVINAATRDTADQDASVWDWTIDSKSGVYLGEPDRDFTLPSGPMVGRPWPDFAQIVPGHPAALAIDQPTTSQYTLNGAAVSFTAGGYVGNRPKLLFNPVNGRPAWPVLRPHIGKRPPFSPNMHSGAPYLGENGNQAPDKSKSIDPWANRSDGICPSGAPLRTYNVVGIRLPITVTDPNKVTKVIDPLGALDVLAEDKDAIYAGTKVYAGDPRAEPLAIRGNIGDCLALTYTSELVDGGTEVPFSKTNIHVHHVQFDTQASDGVISGFSYEQAIRPYKVVDPQLTVASAVNATVLTLTSVAKFVAGTAIGVGLGTNDIEIRTVKSVNTKSKQVTLDRALTKAHAANQWAGTEFVQYRWYPDVALDNIFFHDHVNSIHGWAHGMVGQIIVEPKGSRWYDPVSGQEIRAGARADIRVDPSCVPPGAGQGASADARNACVLIPGLVDKSYREFALWDITSHEPLPIDSTINLRAEPLADRPCAEPWLTLTTGCGGLPYTPLYKAYAGDPVVIRNLDVGQGTKTLTLQGNRTFLEPRYIDSSGIESSPLDTIHSGVSERFTLVLDGGAGGPNHVPGDYLYRNGEGRRMTSGAWGIIRVLPTVDTSVLQPLPGFGTPAAEKPTCPTNAPVHTFDVTAVDLPSTAAGGNKEGRRAAFVRSVIAQSVIDKTTFPEPLVLHVAAGECIKVNFTNRRALDHASFEVGQLLHDMASSGINVGDNPGDHTVAPGGTRTYTFFADTDKIGAAVISDYGSMQSTADGAYGAIVVAPAGATFTNPRFGNTTDTGSMVDVSVPGMAAYRDATLILADTDQRIGQDTMPYPRDVTGPALVNYRQVTGRAVDARMFQSSVYGDPPTPLVLAYAGDPLRIHVVDAPGSEQVHDFSLGGMTWPLDPSIRHSDALSARTIGPGERLEIDVIGGAGGLTHEVGDFFYGDARRPFAEAGMWGIVRVMPDTCSTGGSAILRCLPGLPSANADPGPTGGLPLPVADIATAPSLDSPRTGARSLGRRGRLFGHPRPRRPRSGRRAGGRRGRSSTWAAATTEPPAARSSP